MNTPAPNVPRIQMVRAAPVRYAGGVVAFPVPRGATQARVQTNPLAFPRSLRVWSVKLRLAVDGKGFPDLAPANNAITIGAASADGGFVSDLVDVRGVAFLVLLCSTGETGSSIDVFEDCCCVFDAGGDVPSDKPYA